MAFTNLVAEAQRFESSVSGAFVGATVTAHATNNTKGNYTQLIASTRFNAIGIIVKCSPAVGAHYLFDIAVGAAASEQVVIPNAYFHNYSVFIPLKVPAGSRISCRSQCSTGGSTATVFCVMVGGTPDISIEEVTHGNSTTTSTGPLVTSPASGVGAYVQIVATTPFHISGMIMTPSNLGAGNIWIFDIGVGAGGSEQLVGQTFGSRDNEFAQHIIPLDIPAGSRIAIRGGCGTNTATTNVGFTFIGQQGNSPRIQKATVVSSLVSITGGTGNAKGAWAQMHSSTAEDCQGLNVRPRLTSASYVLVDVGIGAAGAEKVIFSNFAYYSSYGAIHIPIPIKRGTRISMRAQSP